MNDYRSSLPRLGLGAVSLAMTATTLGLFVFMPATIDATNRVGTEVISAAPPAAKEAVVILERIEVRGVREAAVASAVGTAAYRDQRTEPIGASLPNIYRVNAAASGSLPSAERNLSAENRPPRKQ